MWKQCEHCPHTSGQSSPGTLPAARTACQARPGPGRRSGGGAAAPGPPRPPPRPHSQSGQQPLKAIRQIPQFSSLATHSQEATPCQLRTRTRIARPAGSPAPPHKAPRTSARGRRAFAAGPAPSASGGGGAARPEVQAPERSRHHGRQDGHVPGRYH